MTDFSLFTDYVGSCGLVIQLPTLQFKQCDPKNIKGAEILMKMPEYFWCKKFGFLNNFGENQGRDQKQISKNYS